MNELRLRERLSGHGIEVGVAALAAVAAVAGSLLAVGVTPAFVVAGAASILLELTPDTLIAVGIGTLRDLAKPLLAAGAGALVLLSYAGITFGVSQGIDSSRKAGKRAAVTMLLLFGLTYLLTRSPLSSAGAALAAGAVVLAGSSVFDPVGVSKSRRRLLRAGVAAIGAVGIGGFARRGGDSQGVQASVNPAAQSLLDDANELGFSLPDTEGMISDKFYQVDITTANPDVSPADWSLSVTGLVEEEKEFTLEEIREFPAERRFVTLRCVSDTMNGRKMDTALWTGVPVSEILDAAGAPDSCCVTLHGADDYYVSFPREALDPGLFAYGMNGTQLPRGHGFPLRTLVPGHWGETNAKWLTEIEIREEPEDGYWESRGWEGTGEVHTVAKLHGIEADDGAVRIGGHAYAGTRGISAVEVSTDGGDSWAEATLSETLPGAAPVEEGETSPEPDGEAKDAWRMWEHEYEKSGTHEVVVRAVDGTGTVQPAEQQKSFPEGAKGWVRETVQA